METNDWTRRDFMVATATAVAGAGLLTYPSASSAATAHSISLPKPKTDGHVSVEAALRHRRSIRNFASKPLTLEDVSQLCWAAQGVTDAPHRTAPSARAIYPLELYLLAGEVTGVTFGLYHYVPAGHSLEFVASGDKRADLDTKALRQPWNPISQAPAVFVISGDAGKMTSSDDPLVKARGVEFMWAELGLAAQGFFLEATARGLGSVFTGGFHPQEAQEVLGLPAPQEVLALLPVGRRIS
ncbi:MAG TPA: SagB/ThcOx family dehydrogenase [Anaeromyxobacter sp.]|nr:SagB/ThcOx family dehydrogenase [Anaeromyxobacter sp.]